MDVRKIPPVPPVFHITDSYLLLAELGINELIANKHSQLPSPPHLTSFEYPTIILIPIIFCIKHSVEVYLKTTTVLTKLQYKPVHDIDFYLRPLIEKIESFDLEKIRNELIIFDEHEFQNYKNEFKELYELIYYFRDYGFLEEKKIASNIQDGNELFRYGSIKIDLDAFIKSFSNNDLLELAQKINKLAKCMSSTLFAISCISRHEESHK